MIEVSYRVTGLRALSRRLDRARAAVTDWRPLQPQLVAELSAQMSRYAIPVLTGLLRASLTLPGHPAQVARVQGMRLTFGSAVPYARTRLGALPPVQLAPLLAILSRRLLSVARRTA